MHRALIIIWLSLVSANAATYPAASASRADVATAVGLASSGDTVTIPSGSATWATPISIPDGVKITGAGIGSTVLTTAGSGIFSLGDSTWVEGITMEASGGTTSSWFNDAQGTNIVIKGVRFDCSSVSAGGGVLMAIYHQLQEIQPNGVMSGCTLVDTRAVINSPYIDGQHIRWAQPTAFGAQDTFYFEDCLFQWINTGHTALDAQYGGSYVARFNTFSNCFPSMHTIQTGNGRAVRKWEIYKNNFIGGLQPNAVSTTATGVLYSNTCSGELASFEAIMTVSYARAYEAVGTGGKADGNSNWDGLTALHTGTHSGANNAATLTDSGKSWTVNEFVISGWSRWIYNLTDGSKAQCTANGATTFTGTLSGGTDNDWDTGDSYKITDGYLARDQPGAGKDASTWTGAYTNAAPAQSSEPIYIWNNSGFTTPLVVLNDQGQPQSAQLIQEGRDYIYSAHPSYTALAYPHPLLGESAPATSPSKVSMGGTRVTAGGTRVTIQ